MTVQNDQIEPLLCLARDHARNTAWVSAHRSLRAARDYLELNRKPEPAELDILALIQRSISAAERSPVVLGDPSKTTLGDGEQIAVLLRSFINSAQPEFDATLECALVEIDGVPTIRLSLDGPGQFPGSVNLGYGLILSRETIETAWTNATRGGRIDAAASALHLRLKGVRMCTDPLGVNPKLLEAVRDAERHARLLASGECGAEVAQLKTDLANSISAAFEQIDSEDDTFQPSDLVKLMRDAVADADPTAPVHISVRVVGELPPITIRRNRILRSIRTLQNLACCILPNGGDVEFSLEHDLAARAVNFWVNLKGKIDAVAAEWFVPGLRRCIAECHEGTVEADIGSDTMTLLLSLPDKVAQTLDEWLPHWDTFAPRSIQMLRLLKSGGPVPPEELILAGVLEDELERRLLPRLSVAPATNLAHDLKPQIAGLPGASAERIEKSLNQIRRGKPKKEICSPASAGEILHQYVKDERHRSALGVYPEAQEDMNRLVRGLLMSKIDYIDCLRLLPLVLAPPSPVSERLE